jgi:membrane protease YdiL (CAAX protease family)
MTSSRAARFIHVLTGIFLLVILFHVAVLLRLLPYEVVWGGKLQSDEQMYRFEGLSPLLNLLLIGLLLLKRRNLRQGYRQRWLDWTLGGFGVLFALNTVGNLMAESCVEQIAFTALTLVTSVLIFSILRAKTA